MLSLRAFTLNLYRTPAPPVRSAARLKTRLSAADSGKPRGWGAYGIGFTLSNSLLIITAALAGSCGTILGSIMREGGGGMLLATIAPRANRILCGRIASSGGGFRIPVPIPLRIPLPIPLPAFGSVSVTL